MPEVQWQVYAANIWDKGLLSVRCVAMNSQLKALPSRTDYKTAARFTGPWYLK